MSHDPDSSLPEAEKLTDVSDRASDIEQRNTAQAIYDARKNTKPQQMPRADGSFAITDCDECGLEIGEARLAVAIKNRLCIHCAADLERRR